MGTLNEKTLYEKTKQNKTKTVNRSCQYEVMGTFRKRNNPSRQIFVPDL